MKNGKYVNKGRCMYLDLATAKTQYLYLSGRVHTPFYNELFTYEKDYIITQMRKEGF